MDTRKSHSDSQTNPVTCTVLYTKSNALRLARVVGSQRCRRMISFDKQVYMLVTGGDEDMWMVVVFLYTRCVRRVYLPVLRSPEYSNSWQLWVLKWQRLLLPSPSPKPMPKWTEVSFNVLKSFHAWQTSENQCRWHGSAEIHVLTWVV